MPSTRSFRAVSNTAFLSVMLTLLYSSEFLPRNGHSSDSDSFSIDGELVFTSFSSQRFDDEAANPYTS